MAELAQIVRFLQLNGEVEWIEAKNANTNPELIGQYLSALSNAAALSEQLYGYLLFGLEDESFQVKGSAFEPRKEKRGAQELENWLNTLLDPRMDLEILEEKIGEHRIVGMKIQAARYKPVLFQGQAWIRIGSYKKLLKEHPEKERKLWLVTTQKVFEKLEARTNITEAEILSLLDSDAYFQLLNITKPNTEEGIIEKLEQDKIVRKDLNRWSITNLGAILFARDINQFGSLARKSVRVINYKENNRIDTIKEVTGKFGYALGFERMIEYLNNLLPGSEVIEKAIRKEVKLYPRLALREIIANAMIHQDFTISGAGPMVEIFSNRIEVTNPGKPLISTDRFIDHSPQSRNEMLAGLMRRMGMCEERGSGIDKVVSQCELFQLPAPEFYAEDKFTRVVIFAPRAFKEMDKADRTRACYQHCVLKFITGEYMTNQSLRERFGIEEKNYPMVSRVITDAKSAGRIKDLDPENKANKHSKYIPYWA